MSDSHASTVSARILIVDDEENIRRLFAAWVAALGHSALTAASADEALMICRREPVDVALCDIRMPDRDGQWLIAQLRQSHPAIPIIVATGVIDLPPLLTLRAGVFAYLVKPFSRQALEKVIERTLGADPASLASRSFEPAVLFQAFDAIDSALTRGRPPR